MGTKLVLYVIYYAHEVCTYTVHLVYIGDLWNTVLVCLSPDGLALRLDTSYSAESSNRTVQNTQRSLHLYGEVHVARSVDKVDLVFFIVVLPECSGSCRSDGNTSLLLLNHPVHCGCTVMNLTNLVSLTSVVKDSFRCGCFTGIYVGHDADVSRIFKVSCHFLSCFP